MGVSLPCEGPGGSRSNKWDGVQVEASCPPETMWLMCEDIKLGIETPDEGPQEGAMGCFHASVSVFFKCASSLVMDCSSQIEPVLQQASDPMLVERPMPIDDVLCEKRDDVWLLLFASFSNIFDEISPEDTTCLLPESIQPCVGLCKPAAYATYRHYSCHRDMGRPRDTLEKQSGRAVAILFGSATI